MLGVGVLPAPIRVGAITLDVNTLAVACAMVVMGFQAILCALFTTVYGSAEGFLPEDKKIKRLLTAWSLERGIWVGALLASAGVAGLLATVARWHSVRFGHLDYEDTLRIILPSITALVGSCQIILGTFFLSILSIRRSREEEKKPEVWSGTRSQVAMGLSVYPPADLGESG